MLMTLAVAGCAEADFLTVGTRVGALPDSLWAVSEWISAADAPVPEGTLDAPGGARSVTESGWKVSGG